MLKPIHSMTSSIQRRLGLPLHLVPSIRPWRIAVYTYSCLLLLCGQRTVVYSDVHLALICYLDHFKVSIWSWRQCTLYNFVITETRHTEALARTAFADVAGFQIDFDFFVARSRRVKVFVWNADPTRLTSRALAVCQRQNVGRTTEKSKSVLYATTDSHTPVFRWQHNDNLFNNHTMRIYFSHSIM